MPQKEEMASSQSDESVDVHPAPLKNQLRLLWLANALLALVAVTAAVATLISGTYDWDIDHEMYFGQQLLHGIPIWVAEYHDKLPFVQQVFALPALLHSVRVWQVMSLVVLIASVGVARAALPRTDVFRRIPKHVRVATAWTGALAFAFWCTVLPGGITMINTAASGLWLMFALGLYLWATYAVAESWAALLLIASCASGAMSISLRPYLAAPLVIIGLYAVLRRSRTTPDGVATRSIRNTLLVVLLLGGFVLGLNLWPYAVFGGAGAIPGALRMQLSDLNPTPSVASLIASIDLTAATLWVPVALALVGAAVLVAARWPGRWGLATFAGALLALLAFILRSHWWPHYVTLFGGAATLVLSWVLVGLQDRSSRRWVGKKDRWAGAGLAVIGLTLVVSGLLAGREVVGEAAGLVAFGTSEHREASSVRSVEAYLARPGNRGLTFLAPESMYVHWALDEPRHGFPHAANTGHIYSGWWQRAPRGATFAVPRNADEYCSRLQEQGPDVIVVPEGSEIAKCLSAPSSRYVLDTTAPQTEGPRLSFFRAAGS